MGWRSTKVDRGTVVAIYTNRVLEWSQDYGSKSLAVWNARAQSMELPHVHM